MAATIKEIATRAGVSRGTVDRALHNRKGVSPEKAKHIQILAEEMGYYPDKAGKILAAKKKPVVIGCLIPSIGNEFFRDVIKGFKDEEAALSDFGISLIIKEIRGYDKETHIEAINELLNQKVHALCLSTIDVAEVRELISSAHEKGVVTIAVNTDITDAKRLCYVGSNYLEGGKTAAGMFSFIAGNESNLLIATGSRLMKGHNERIEGFIGELSRKAVKYNLVDIIETQDHDTIAYERTLDVLRAQPEINSIFLAAAGAAGVCKAVKELKRLDCMTIMSFDAVNSTKKLIKDGIIDFTICQEPIEQGRVAINTLFNYFMNNRKKQPKSFFTQTVIKIKENL